MENKNMKTAFEVAADLIRRDVETGLTAQDIGRSWAGSFRGGNRVGIGDYANVKKYGSDKIVVSELNGKKCLEVFNVQDVMNHILEAKNQLSLFDRLPLKNGSDIIKKKKKNHESTDDKKAGKIKRLSKPNP